MSRVVSETLTIHVPFTLRQRGGRKVMLMPEGISARQTQPDNTLVKALARAFRWKRMLESGEFTTIAELAVKEGIAPSYMTRVLRLTLLAPEIVEAIRDGMKGAEIRLTRLMEPPPLEWKDQLAWLR